jgi:hypothetical protein
MVYLYDMIFVLCFLGFKQFMKYTQDTNMQLFEYVRQYGFWVEFSFILLAIYFAPQHTGCESGVSFAICMLTKLIVDFVLPENYRK